MKHLFLGLALALGLVLAVPVSEVAADSDSGSDSWGGSGATAVSAPELDATVAGSAMVLLLGGVAYLASRRRKDD